MSAQQTIQVGGEWREAALRRHPEHPRPRRRDGPRHRGGGRRRGRRRRGRRGRAGPSTTGHWPHTPAAERAALLRRVGRPAPARPGGDRPLESRDTGKTLEEGRVDVDDVTNAFRYFADLVVNECGGRVVDAGSPDVHSVVVHEPVGVCALITPWNYPLLQASWKIAPGARRGQHLRDQAQRDHPADHRRPGRAAGGGRAAGRCGQPRHRRRATAVGARLAEHPDVDLVSFTGGLVSGTKVDAGRRARREEGRAGTRRQEPQRGLRRRLRHRRGLRHRRRPGTERRLHPQRPGLLRRRPADHRGVGTRPLRRRTRPPRRADRLGRGTEDGVECGPLVSAQQLDKIEGYVASALAEGARAALRRSAARAVRRPAGRRLLLLADRAGPLPPRHAGGPGGDLRADPDRRDLPHRGRGRGARQRHRVRPGRRRLVRPTRRAPAGSPGRLRHGTVWINDYHPYLPQAEWGGFGKSGIGRELGPTGLAEYRETKHIYENLGPRRCAGSRADARGRLPGAPLAAEQPTRSAAHRDNAATHRSNPQCLCTTTSSSAAAPPVR